MMYIIPKILGVDLCENKTCLYYTFQQVSFLIPECGILSKELKNLVTETGPYYFVKNLPIYELITHEFINTFVKKGKKNHAVSMNVAR